MLFGVRGKAVGIVLSAVAAIGVIPNTGNCRIEGITTMTVGNKVQLTSVEMSTPAGQPNRLYYFEQLVLGSVVDYESIQEYASPGNAIAVIGTPDAATPAGSQRTSYIFDAALNTGLLNISTAAPGLTVIFDRPIVNLPGQEIVIFELTVGNGQTPDPLVVESADGAGRARAYGSSAYEFAGIIPQEIAPQLYSVDVGTMGTCNLAELLYANLSLASITNPKFHALPINLDALNIPEGDSIQSLIIRSSVTDPLRAADILMVVGMISLPEPDSAILTWSAGLWLTVHVRRRRVQRSRA